MSCCGLTEPSGIQDRLRQNNTNRMVQWTSLKDKDSLRSPGDLVCACVCVRLRARRDKRRVGGLYVDYMVCVRECKEKLCEEFVAVSLEDKCV